MRLGANADPGKFLMVALENVQYETLLLYEIRPFVTLAESRDSTNAATNTRVFRVPVFGPEFKRQRYNMIVYGKCPSHARTSFKNRPTNATLNRNQTITKIMPFPLGRALRSILGMFILII